MIKIRNLAFFTVIFSNMFFLSCFGGSAPAGYYRYGSVNYPCHSGCYCEGGANQLAGVMSCDPASGTLKFGALTKENGWRGAHLCPKEFPESDPGAKTINDCYKDDNGKAIYYGSEVECKAGNYLPKNSKNCESCSKAGLEPNEYCPKGTYYFSDTKNQGITDCPSGQVHSADFKECVSGIECYPGEYLRKDSYTCESCSERTGLKNNEYCPGGTYKYSKDRDSQPATCPAGQTPNAERSACGTCNPGQYIDSNRTCQNCPDDQVPNETLTGCKKCPKGQIVNDGRCVAEEEAPFEPIECTTPGQYYNGAKKACDTCKGSTRYCPGGTYNKNLSRDHGIYDCPAGGVVNNTGDACTITLSKDMMIYGPGGKTTESVRQCWNFHNNIGDYTKCLFGGDVKKKE